MTGNPEADQLSAGFGRIRKRVLVETGGEHGIFKPCPFRVPLDTRGFFVTLVHDLYRISTRLVFVKQIP